MVSKIRKILDLPHRRQDLCEDLLRGHLAGSFR